MSKELWEFTKLKMAADRRQQNVDIGLTLAWYVCGFGTVGYITSLLIGGGV